MKFKHHNIMDILINIMDWILRIIGLLTIIVFTIGYIFLDTKKHPINKSNTDKNKVS